jgi:DNA-binding response OmpR family regulator
MFAVEDSAIPHPSEFVPGIAPVARFPFGPDCWYEAALARVICQDQEILLTPRENALLSLLLSAPDQWHRTGDLAALLSERCGGVEISLQSIRQTMLGLRRKLGESSAAPDLLQCRPGHGYGIFPPKVLVPDA